MAISLYALGSASRLAQQSKTLPIYLFIFYFPRNVQPQFED